MKRVHGFSHPTESMITSIPMRSPCPTSCLLAADFCVSSADMWLTPWCWDEANQNLKSSEGYKKKKGVSLAEVSASDGIFCNGRGLCPETEQAVGKRQGPSIASFRCWTTGTGYTGTKISHVQSTVVWWLSEFSDLMSKEMAL